MFFSTEIKNSGWAVSIGDFGLRPYHYLFGGRAVEIINQLSQESPIRTFRDDWSDSRYLSAIVKTACAIALLLPGLLLALCFKGIASLCYRESKKEAPPDTQVAAPATTAVVGENKIAPVEEISDQHSEQLEPTIVISDDGQSEVVDFSEDEEVLFYEITEQLPTSAIAIHIFVDETDIDGALKRVLAEILDEVMPHDIVINTPKTCVELPASTLDALNEFIKRQSLDWEGLFRSKIICTGGLQRLEGATRVSSIAEAMQSDKHYFLIVSNGVAALNRPML